MTNKQIWAYSAHGNYSTCHGWENGMSGYIHAIEDMKELKRAQDYININSADQWVKEPAFRPMYCVFFNDYAGSRSENGYILAFSQEEAQSILDAYLATYEVIEYEQDPQDLYYE